MPAIPSLGPITRKLQEPGSAKHHPGLPLDINNYLPLQLRDPSPRGGGGHGGHSSSHSSSSKSKGSSSKGNSSSGSSTTVVVVGGGPRYYGPHNNLLLPVWAIVLIVVLVFETILFCCALGWFTKQAKSDRKTLYPTKPRPPLRYSRIWLNAFIVASWLWIPIGFFNIIMGHFVDPKRGGIKKERHIFLNMDDGMIGANERPLYTTTLTRPTPYKGAGVGAGAANPETMNVKRTNSAYTKLPSGEVKVEEVKSNYDTPEDVKVPFEDEKKDEKKEDEKKSEEAAPAYPGAGAFAGYAAAPIPAQPAPASPLVAANEPVQQQGAAASYFAMSNTSQSQSQQQEQQQQGAAASYFAMSQPQNQNLPATNPWGRQ
ncbi:hypothetical protein B0T20DRAFT_425096 [Sordaria brevicollis]|uniref:Uncharacterized protein n=1 Tax=Sordaria brevicollis TaxID=83679 RepID=A0AAE0NWH1_SORBR|nr:hypothetical protein B0T20DRAFT_425096 [Sordaria brevicollis]